MSRTIKLHSLDDAEININHLNYQIAAMQSQVAASQAIARQEAQQIADARVRQIKAETESRFNGVINDLQRQLDREINAEKQARIRAEQEHQHALQKQANDFYGKLQSEIAGVKDWTQDKINTLQDTVNRQLQNQQSQINDVRQQVRNLYEKEADAEKRAANLIADVLDRLNKAKNSRHQKYMPGRLNQIINQVQNLANSTDPAASRIAIAQTALNDIWNLEDDIARAQAKFETLRQVVLKESDTIILEMSKHRNVAIKSEETGNEVALEINYWTNGAFNKLENEAKELKIELEEKKDTIELNEERLNIIHSRLAEIKNEQSKLREETIKKGIESEVRAKTCNTVVNAMIQEGYRLIDMNYMGNEEKETENDWREGTFAILEGRNGEEITVIMNTKDSCTQALVQRNDDERTESDFRRGLQEIKTRVKKLSGIDLGDSMPIPSASDNVQTELADPVKLARKGIARDVKKRLGLTQ